MPIEHVWSEAVAMRVDSELCPSVLIVCEVRFVREGLAEFLGRDRRLSILGFADDLAGALAITLDLQPDIVLLDAAFPDAVGTVGWFQAVASQVRVIAFAATETEENIIAWAEAGVAGYVPKTAALADLVALLTDIVQGKQRCSGCVAAGLLHKITTMAESGNRRRHAPGSSLLTARELQIIRLLADGLSNKEIARRLVIEVATTKSHVHNLLEKLNLARRGQAALWLRQHERGTAPLPVAGTAGS